MKKTIIALAVITAFGTTVKAQAVTGTPATATSNKEAKKNLTPEERAAKSTAMAEKKLGLTAYQKENYQVMALKRNTANQPLHDQLQGSTTPEQRKSIHDQIKMNNKSFEESVMQMLTAEQKPKFTAMKEERKQARMKETKKKFEEVDQDYGE